MYYFNGYILGELYHIPKIQFLIFIVLSLVKILYEFSGSSDYT